MNVDKKINIFDSNNQRLDIENYSLDKIKISAFGSGGAKRYEIKISPDEVFLALIKLGRIN